MVNLADFGGPQFKPNEPGPGGHGQQGTLFSNRRLNAANRTGDEVGHRGYSPNRLAEVRDVVHVDVKSAPFTPTLNAALSGIEAKGIRHGKTDEDTLPQRQSVATKLTQGVVHENIARSTVPTSTLRNSVQMVGGVQERGTSVSVQPMQGAVGDYNPVTGLIRVNHQYADSSAIIHEIGHQKDWSTPGDTEVPGVRSGATTSRDRTPEQLAKVEGFADAYADRHYRPAPGGSDTSAGGSYDVYTEKDWHDYAAKAGGPTAHDAPDQMGATAATYSDTRKRHGGRDLNPMAGNLQQLQMGVHIQGVADINDRSWEPALGQQAR